MTWGEIVTAALGVAALMAGVWQLQRQYIYGIKLQRAHLRDQLNLEVYRKLDHTFVTALDQLLNIVSLLGDVYSSVNLGLDPRKTGEEFVTEHQDAMSKMPNLLTTLESWEIVFPNLRRARARYSAKYLEMAKAASDLVSSLLPYMTVRLPQQPAAVLGVPSLNMAATLTDDQRALLAAKYEAFSTAYLDLAAYIYDFRIIAQNTLLSDVFERTVPPRNPTDPTATVLTRDDEPMTERPPGSFV